MARFVQGADRRQVQLLQAALDDYVDEDRGWLWGGVKVRLTSDTGRR